jgi:uncharacterized protein (DUF983 family)
MGFYKKGTKMYSITNLKCPRCHEGDLFVHSNPYRLKGFAGMPESCPVCGQPYVLESGFYWGSMYLNYIGSVAMGGIIFLILFYLAHLSFLMIIIIMTILLLILSPLLFRYSRAIWINIFVKYEAGKIKE